MKIIKLFSSKSMYLSTVFVSIHKLVANSFIDTSFQICKASNLSNFIIIWLFFICWNSKISLYKLDDDNSFNIFTFFTILVSFNTAGYDQYISKLSRLLYIYFTSKVSFISQV